MGDGLCDSDNINAMCHYDSGDCCDESLIGNGRCDAINKFANCQFDGGDCCTDYLIGNRICDNVNNFPNCSFYDGGDCRPPNIPEWPKCLDNPKWIGDGTCDEHFKTKAECNYDGGDCCDNTLIGNRLCNDFNNFTICNENYDGGDCRPPNITEWPACPINPALLGDGRCDSKFKWKSECNYDSPDCCPNDKVGDGKCDRDNLNDQCMNDGGDCCNKQIGPGT